MSYHTSRHQQQPATRAQPQHWRWPSTQGMTQFLLDNLSCKTSYFHLTLIRWLPVLSRYHWMGWELALAQHKNQWVHVTLYFVVSLALVGIFLFTMAYFFSLGLCNPKLGEVGNSQIHYHCPNNLFFQWFRGEKQLFHWEHLTHNQRYIKKLLNGQISLQPSWVHRCTAKMKLWTQN